MRWVLLFLSSLALQAAVIDGVVVEGRSGKPLARARVTLEPVRGGSVGRSLTLLTDSAGAFRFTELAAGTYQVLVKRQGFVTAHYGQTEFDGAGSPVAVEKDGQFSAYIPMTRPGAIAGSVVDENEVGLVRTSVSAYRLGSRIRLAGSAVTDDRGEFRLSGLDPGRYVVVTSPRVLEDGRGLLPTYYGQTVARAEARTVEVRLEEDFKDVRIQPLPGEVGRLSGIVEGEGMLAVRLLTDLGMLEERLGAGGSFSFPELPPGSYELLAENLAVDPPISVWKPIQFQGRDQFVSLKAGESPVVRMDCRDDPGKPEKAGSLSVFLERERDPGDHSFRLDCGGTIRLGAGEWKIRLAPLSGAYVESLLEARPGAGARQDTWELTLEPGEVRDLAAVIGHDAARITGEVKLTLGDAAIGAPVLLRALRDDLNQRMGGPLWSRTDSDGKFRFDGLAPGEYEMISSFRLDRADLLDWPLGSGKMVTLDPGEAAEMELELLR